MQTQEIMTTYFFPNPFGDGQSYSIDAASLEDAQAQLNKPNRESVSEPIEEPVTPSESPAPADLSEEELQS